jgi:hypothetical protein
MPLVSTNPATETEIERYSFHTDREVERRLTQATSGFAVNRERSLPSGRPGWSEPRSSSTTGPPRSGRS